MDSFDPYNIYLAIATNIPQLLMTSFVVQGHIWVVCLFAVSGNLSFCVIKLWMFVTLFLFIGRYNL